MPDFECSVCGGAFSVPAEALEKYPNWTPKYCRKHSPKKQAGTQKTSAPPKRSGSSTSELNLSLSEVLARFSEGPESGIFTDGSARPNPGPGGWGVVHVEKGEIVAERRGHEADTTNNRMELTALITGLELAGTDEPRTIYTDSELSLNILTKWAAGWEKNGWKRKSGPIKNLDLVKQAYQSFKEHPNVTIEWIKAHNGWLWNEYADSLACAWDRDEL